MDVIVQKVKTLNRFGNKGYGCDVDGGMAVGEDIAAKLFIQPSGIGAVHIPMGRLKVSNLVKWRHDSHAEVDGFVEVANVDGSAKVADALNSSRIIVLQRVRRE